MNFCDRPIFDERMQYVADPGMMPGNASDEEKAAEDSASSDYIQLYDGN